MKPFSIDLVNTSVSGTQSEPVDLRWCYAASMDTSWAMATNPSPFDVPSGTGGGFDVNDTITEVSHGLSTGMCVRVTINGGSLPSPLLAATDYFVIKLTANTFKLATTRALAVAGTAINLTDIGSDSQIVTFTPQASVASLLIETSPDVDQSEAASPRWRTLSTIDLVGGTSPTVSALASGLTPPFQFIRATLTVTKGALSTHVRSTVYGKNV